MSGTDSEQDKQPISSVNGQTGENGAEAHTPSAEGLKGTSETETHVAVISCHSEATESAKDVGDEDETMDSQSPVIIIINGESTKGHENGELSEKGEENSVVENKPDETPEQVSEEVEAAVENQVVEAGKEVERPAGSSGPEESIDSVVAEANGEQNKVDTVEGENTVSELKEGAEVDDKQNEEQCENQRSEESKVTETDPELADRKRAVTIDNPVDMKELTEKSGDSSQNAEDRSVHERSKTLGDIEGSSSSPLKDDVTARSQTIWYTDEAVDTPSKPETEVSYSTSIVGGVVHKMPINYSPKGQHKSKEGSPQSSPPKKRSVIDSLFGRHKKSKGGPESPPGSSSNIKDDEKESQQNESSPVTPITDGDAAKDDTEPLENGTIARVEDTKVADTDQGAEVKADTVEEGGGVEIKPTAAVESEEGIKVEPTEAAQDSEVKEGEVELNVQEASVPVDDAEEKDEASAEGPKDEQSEETKDAVKRAHSDLPGEEETSPQPAAKKKKPIFGGIFTRRKSKKSKGDVTSPPAETPQENESDKVEDEQQDGSVPTQPADDAKPHDVEGVETLENGTDQGVAPDTSVMTQQEVTEDVTVTVQQEITEDAVSPAVDQAVESAKEEIVDKDNVDRDIGVPETATRGEPSGKEVETAVPEDVQKSAEETVHSNDVAGAVEKEQTEEKLIQTQDSQPEKKQSIFGGFFARRKSKKSKDVDASPPTETPQENEDDKVEEQRDGSAPTQPADDAKPLAVEGVETLENGTDQGAAPDTSDTTATVQQEVTEDAISPAVDQTVESVKEGITDEGKVDGNITNITNINIGVPQQVQVAAGQGSVKEVENVVSEDVQKSAEETSEIVNDQPRVEEPSEDTSKEASAPSKPAVEGATSPKSEEAQGEDTALRERVVLKKELNASHSPKTRRMQMRISYAEKDGEGGREVEVIGTPERVPEATNHKGKTPPDHRVSCRGLGEADHEGWLAKKGGPLFFSSWKRKWVVLKEGKLYYFKTAFDPEASGVINMEGVTVAQAPETKKNFCFKCEQPGPKPHGAVFMADSKEDMDKWLSMLTAASKGEVIHKTKQHRLTVMDEVVMRKKSGSISAQRTSSILAVGGRHDFLEDEEDFKATRRRSTPGSLSKSPKESEEKDEQMSVPSDTQAIASVTHPEASVTQSVPCVTQPVPSDTQPVSEDNQKETNKSVESETTEKPVIEVNEVFVSSEQVAVQSVPSVEVSLEQDTAVVESSDDTSPAVASHEEDKGSEGNANISAEMTAETENVQPALELTTDADSTVDKTDGAVNVVTTESSVTVVETVKSTSVISETVVSVVKTEVTEVSSSQQLSETDELKQEDKEIISEVGPTESDASEPVSPSKTKWYFTLDRQETWSVPPEDEEDKSPSRPKSSGSTSDKGSIKSDRGSIKSSSDDDQLLIMCRNIREARLSIVGEPVWEGADRLRALSSVHDGNEETFVKLRTLERTLKDKEKHLSELEELLTQPEINRDSIYAWKTRYSDLVEELFPQEDGDGQEKIENAAEGGEGETQDRESSEAGKDDEKLKSSDAEGAEREGNEKTSEEVEKKSDEEPATSSKEEGEGMDDKQAAHEGKAKTEEEQEGDEQQTSEKETETKENKNDNLTMEAQESPAESTPLADSEQNAPETETVHENQAEEEDTRL